MTRATAPRMNEHLVIIGGDDASLHAPRRESLEKAGFNVRIEPDALRALDHARDLAAVAVVIAGAPLNDAVLAALRAACDEGLPARFMALLPEGDEIACERGIEAGADAVADVHCSGPELAARVEALLRGSRERQPIAIDTGQAQRDLVIDVAAHSVRRGSETIPLTHRQFQLLLLLARNRGRVVTRRHIYRECWGRDEPQTSRVVDTCVSELRVRIELDPSQPRYIRTVRSTGYMMPCLNS